MEPVRFRTKPIARSLGTDLPQPIILTLGEPQLSVELRPVLDDERDNQYAKTDLMCVGLLKQRPPRAIRTWLGNPCDPLPPAFQAFQRAAYGCLSDAVMRLLRLLRWRIGERSERNPVRRVLAFEWSADGETWQEVPDWYSLGICFGLPIDSVFDYDGIVGTVDDLWQENQDEPLAHELFQEAWSQQYSNPRSSLVVCIAAAEASVKHLISSLAPSGQWLVEAIQSPPIEKMLVEYVPTLPVKTRISGKIPPVAPEWLIATIRKGVNIRNQIVHGKAAPLTGDTLREVLEAVNDLLYYCDLLAGHLWAWKRLSVRLCRYLSGEESEVRT